MTDEYGFGCGFIRFFSLCGNDGVVNSEFNSLEMCCGCSPTAGERIVGSGANQCSEDTTCIDEQCVPTNVGYDCSDDSDCEGDELFCIDSICQEPPNVGDSCLSDEACLGDLICEMGTCSPLLGLGDTCVLFTNRCEDGLVCLNECKEPGFVGEECLFD